MTLDHLAFFLMGAGSAMTVTGLFGMWIEKSNVSTGDPTLDGIVNPPKK